jgi:hypothetical protein
VLCADDQGVARAQHAALEDDSGHRAQALGELRLDHDTAGCHIVWGLQLHDLGLCVERRRAEQSRAREGSVR